MRTIACYQLSIENFPMSLIRLRPVNPLNIEFTIVLSIYNQGKNHHGDQFNLSPLELKSLKQYIEENIANGFIRQVLVYSL